MKAVSAFGSLTNMARAGMACRPCPYCGREHDIVCPRIKAITWGDPPGEPSLIVSVELHKRDAQQGDDR